MDFKFLLRFSLMYPLREAEPDVGGASPSFSSWPSRSFWLAISAALALSANDEPRGPLTPSGTVVDLSADDAAKTV